MSRTRLLVGRVTETFISTWNVRRIILSLSSLCSCPFILLRTDFQLTLVLYQYESSRPKQKDRPVTDTKSDDNLPSQSLSWLTVSTGWQTHRPSSEPRTTYPEPTLVQVTGTRTVNSYWGGKVLSSQVTVFQEYVFRTVPRDKSVLYLKSSLNVSRPDFSLPRSLWCPTSCVLYLPYKRKIH